MIKVDLTKDRLITISGHSGYEERGKDIVCASVSSIVTTSINAIIELNSNAIEYQDLNDKLIIKVISEDDNTSKLINNMIFMLSSLEKDYPKNIKILRR